MSDGPGGWGHTGPVTGRDLPYMAGEKRKQDVL